MIKFTTKMVLNHKYYATIFYAFYPYLIWNIHWLIDDEEDAVICKPPSEKERKHMVTVVSCIGLLITVLAATMVGITLGLSHLMEEPDVFSGRNITGKQFAISKELFRT